MSLRFEKYIAHPYWEERQRMIQIQLHSGMNRLKLEEKKRAALESQCEKEGITLADYEGYVRKAAREWYRVDCDDPKSPIVIPRHHLAGCLVEAISRSPKAVRGKYDADSFRHHVRISDFATKKVKADGTYTRAVKLEKTNMRPLQSNEYIEDFVATGTLSVTADTPEKDVKDLRRLLAFAVSEVGTGASRKMGYGRGEIVKFDGE